MTQTLKNSEWTRRGLLGLGLVAGTATVLAGCTPPEKSTPHGSSGPMTIPDSGAKIPKKPTKLRWMDTGQVSGGVVPTFVTAYAAKYPQITIDYNNIQGKDYTTAAQLAFQNQDLPDILRALPGRIVQPAAAVEKGLLLALDDVIPNFKDWKAAFPKGHFLEGLNQFNGKTYSFPILGDYTLALELNRDVLDKAGYDFESKAPTWDEFRAAARKITKQGNGAVSGLTLAGAVPNRWRITVDLLASLAGAPGGKFDFRRGEYNYSGEAYQEAVELILAMRKDGSIDPGVISLTGAQAQSKIPVGKAGMIINETGNVPKWLSNFPDFNLGIAALPVPDRKHHGYIGKDPSNSYWWASSESKAPEVIGDIFSYFGSEKGLTAWQKVGDGALPVIFPKANQNPAIDKRLRKAHENGRKIVRLLPEPQSRNPEVSVALAHLQPAAPGLGNIMQGLYTGQLTDAKAALKSLQDRSEAALDKAIATARSQGANVSRQDWIFPDWNPDTSYVTKPE